MAALDDQKKTGLPLFMIRGIQLRLDYSWFIVFALVFVSLSAGYFPRAFPDQSAAVYWTAGFVATLLFFLSVVTHELAHSLMAIRSGIQVPEITLFLFGGMARISEEAGDPRTEFKIAVVGPLTSFALALVFWVIELALRGDQPTMVVEIFSYLAWINIALGVFNLLPGFPLDGGRILRAFWWWKTGSMVEATRVASDWGKGLAIVIMIMGGLQIFAGGLVGGLWLIFIGMFLRGVAEVSYQELALKKSLEGTRAADLMVRDVITAPPDLPVKGLISDYFLRYGYRGFPVTTDGKTLGVISISNVRDVPENEQATRTVGQLMAPLEPHMIISPETSANEILTHMSQNNLGRVLVMRDDHMLGMVTRTGLLRFMEMKRILGRPEMQQAR
jgi:Zn-dependent protease/predicted transcriptional regulator